MDEEQFIKEAQTSFASIGSALASEISSIRGNRPTVDLVEHIQVTCYENQQFTIQQLGSISINGANEIIIAVWDAGVSGAITKAIEEARLGLSVSSEGTIIRARLSALGAERRDELTRTVKKTGEQSRIQVRTKRDECMKRIKAAEETKELSQDRAFKLRERMQKIVDATNDAIEASVEKKLLELSD
ncbi:MAG: hypothetical protein RIQ54_390 [Candidatus Parcubacteria bacterium]|jgi:ribosome recycling factor